MVEQLDEVTIRVATEGDAAGIARVHVRSWQEAYAGIVPDAYLASLDADERTAQWGTLPARGPGGRDPHLGRPGRDRVVGLRHRRPEPRRGRRTRRPGDLLHLPRPRHVGARRRPRPHADRHRGGRRQDHRSRCGCSRTTSGHGTSTVGTASRPTAWTATTTSAARACSRSATAAAEPQPAEVVPARPSPAPAPRRRGPRCPSRDASDDPERRRQHRVRPGTSPAGRGPPRRRAPSAPPTAPSRAATAPQPVQVRGERRRGVQVDPHAARARDPAGVPQQPVGHVEHRGRPGARRRRSGRQRATRAAGRRPRARASSSATARVEQRETGRRPPGHARRAPRRRPARAPERSTGARPARSPCAVTATTTTGPPDRSPPDDADPERRALGGQPARQPLDPRHRQVRAGSTSATTRLVGRAPIAATSARFCTAARRPTSSPEDHARRKCRSSTSTSVVTTNRPSGAATTAASSPGATSVSAPTGRSGKMRASSASSDSSETSGPSVGAGVSPVTRTR